MKAGWEAATIGAHCRFENGDRGKNYPGRKAFVPEGIPFVNAGHLREGLLDLSEMNFIPRDHFERLGSGKIKTGDLLFCLRGSLGKYAVVDNLNEGAIASSLVIVRPTERLIPHYLGYYFGSPLCINEITRYANGTAQPNLSAKSLAAFEIPLPPIEEQQRIVAILDDTFEGLDRARANADANLRSARELFPAILTALLTRTDQNWSKKSLAALCEKITDGTHQTPKYFDEGYIFLSSKNVTSGKIDWENIKFVDEAQHRAMQKRLSPRVGDVLLAKNGTTGVAAIVDRDVTFDVYVSLALLRAKAEILPEFLLYFTNSSLAKSQFDKRLKGSGVPNLHLQEIREVIMPFPKDLEAQKWLVQLFDQQRAECEATVASSAAKLQDIADLRQSLLKKAFAGELT